VRLPVLASTHSDRRSSSMLIYPRVDSGLAWPSRADIVGNGTAAAQQPGRGVMPVRRRVPAFTSATPALRERSAVTRIIEA